MQFDFEQRFGFEAADVADAFSDPAFYAALEGATKLGAPDVIAREVDGDTVDMRIRYRFAGDLSPAVRAAIDPGKLTWVEHSIHDLVGLTVRFVLEPDHYADRLKASGTYRYTVDPGDDTATILSAAGEVKVRAPLVAGTVERAIISGLREHLEQQAATLAAFLSG